MADVKIRQAVADDAPGIARVHVDTWRTTYAGIMPHAVLAGLSYARREQGWRGILEAADSHSYIYVAEDEHGEIVGLVSAGPIRDEMAGYDGEIYAIYVLQQHQGKGYGRRLMSAAAQRLQAEGFSSMMLWVAAENPASRRFYEARGGVPIAEKEDEIEGAKLVEVGYGWKDLTLLAG